MITVWTGCLAVAIAAAVSAGSAQTVRINGAGATFPNPIYTKWFSEYNKLHPNVEVNYQSLGSGAGIRQLTARTVFFGATDAPMTQEQLLAAPGKIVHLPTVLGAVVPVYNIPGVTQELKFTGQVLADIYLGKITQWNDPALTAINPGVPLPASAIAVVHRSDGSGTTYIWVDFLSKVSKEFLKTVGVASSVKWPTGIGAKGNEGVAGMITQTPGTIGYVELVYALQNKITYGSVQNSSGAYIRATVDAVTAAASAAVSAMPADFRVSITNPPGKDAYPIASFTWLLFFENPQDKNQSRVMMDFMRWALTDGQKFARELGYAPLPPALVEVELKALQRIRVQS